MIKFLLISIATVFALGGSASAHHYRHHHRYNRHWVHRIIDPIPGNPFEFSDRHHYNWRGGSGRSGIASVYNGGRGACGGHVSPGALVAASPHLPCGSMHRVTNTRTGRSVEVRIVDRGPFVRGRIIDLTPAAAHVLGFAGLAHVTVD